MMVLTENRGMIYIPGLGRSRVRHLYKSAPSTNLDREIPKENVTSWSNGFIGDRNDFRS